VSETISVPLHSKRRQRAMTLQHLQHAIPAFGLAIGGIQALQAGAHGFEFGLAIAEVLTSSVLVVALARHLRHSQPSHHHRNGIDWITVFAAAMLFTEAGEKWNHSGKWFSPQTLTAVATLVTALLNERLSARRQRRRMLHISEDEIAIARGPLRPKFSVPWQEVKAIEVHEHEALIHTHAGRHERLNLKDLHNAHEVAAALRAAQHRLLG